MAKFDFVAALKADGVWDNEAKGGMEDERFYYRFVRNDVQLGIKSSFDRWANSVDFVFATPKTLGAYEKLKNRIDTVMRSGDFNKGRGQETRL